MPRMTSGDSIWRDWHTAYAPFTERGMEREEISKYFKLHGVPSKMDPPYAEHPMTGAKVRQKRLFDMRAVRLLVQVYDINQERKAREAQAEAPIII